MFEIREVLRLWAAGLWKRRIAAQVGLNVKTVRRYLTAALAAGVIREEAAHLDEERFAGLVDSIQPVRGRLHGKGWEVCEGSRAIIVGYLTGSVRLSKIRKLLRRRGVEVSYATLRRFAIAELGFGDSGTTIPVADCDPGQEVQIDVGWMTHLDPDERGRRRRFRALIFTAVRSRHRFVWPISAETTAAMIEGCEAAWEFFGGIFRVVIPDNTKAIVQEADPLEPRIVEAFLEYSQARGFFIDPARVRHAKDKGRVERAVPTVRDDCYGGERLYTIEAARLRGRWWCLEEYGMRRHSRTLRMPREQFEVEERPALLPAPTEPYDVPIWCDPKVARDQCAQVVKSLYSLPTKFVGRKLRARADRNTVRFYDSALLVKTHPRVAPGKRSVDPADYPPEKAAYAFRDVKYLACKAEEHGQAVGEYARLLLSGPLPWTKMRQVYALLDLTKKFGPARVEEACRAAIEAEVTNVYRLRHMIEHAVLGTPEALPPNVVPIARYLRPSSQFALPFERPQGGDA